MSPSLRRGRLAACAAAVFLIAAAAFAPSVTHDFVAFDDPAYAQHNPAVLEGLAPASVRWAFTSFHASNWHPLTWLTLMADVELFGPGPAGHHAVNALAHAGAAAALFLLLAALTGRVQPSLLASLAFALHPLRVESVSWIAERKDVLAALLWVLCVALYLRQARRPAAGPRLALPLLFLLGLTAKPTLVALPLALLALDLWPLGSLRRAADLPRAVRAKGALFALAAAAALVTLAAQAPSRPSLELLPAPVRLANAAVSVTAYLAQTLWPARLAVYYPLEHGGPPAGAAAGALALLLALSGVAALLLRRRPYLAAGWLWYLAALVPVLGFVQVGDQARADRYTYLPSIGLFLAAFWLASDLARPRRWLRAAAGAAGLLTVALWCALTVRQQRSWVDTLTLCEHTLRVTRRNPLVHYVCGAELAERGRSAEAREQFRRALELRPKSVALQLAFAAASEDLGDNVAAIAGYRAALAIEPRHADAHYRLGLLYAGAGDRRAAIEHYRAAIDARPDFAEARNALERSLAAGAPR